MCNVKERRKWIHFFDGVTGIIFAASLTSYDEVLWFDEDENGMMESLQVFNEQVNNTLWTSPVNGNIPIFLFLTKSDLFVDKIKRVPLTVTFPDYKGKQNAQVMNISNNNSKINAMIRIVKYMFAVCH